MRREIQRERETQRERERERERERDRKRAKERERVLRFPLEIQYLNSLLVFSSNLGEKESDREKLTRLEFRNFFSSSLNTLKKVHLLNSTKTFTTVF